MTKKLPTTGGYCGACKTTLLPVVEAKKVLSKSFGSWADIDPDGNNHRNLCLACASAYQHKPTIYYPTIITTDHDLSYPTPEQLRIALNGPIRPTTAILLPIYGKKAVAPVAEWGKLTIDSGATAWTRSHAKVAAALLKLRAIGYAEAALFAPSPGEIDRRPMTPALWEQIYQLWPVIAAAQTDRNLYPALIKMTRKKFA